MRTSTFTVADIHCGGCEQMIRTLLGEVAGVQEVDPDQRTNRVMVTYDDSQLDDTAIRQALADTGFQPI